MTKLDDKIKFNVDKNNWIVYGQPEGRKCPNCEILKQLLRLNNIGFVSINIATPEALTELAFRGSCFPKFTPVLQKGDNIYYKQLWKRNKHGEELDIMGIKYIIDPDKKDWIDWIDLVDLVDIEDTKQKCEDGVCQL